MSRRRATILVLWLLGAVIVIGAGAAVALAAIGPRALIERYASAALHRRLTIGSLQIGWGQGLSVELRDLRLANMAGGSSPYMVTIESLSAEIDAWSLLVGAPRYRRLDVTKPIILLERDAAGTGNWRFGDAGPSSPDGAASGNRAWFPTLIDFHLHGGQVSYRTSSGAVLQVDMQEATIGSDGADAPVTLAVDGAYNGTPAHLAGETQSFATLRNASAPFGVNLSLSGASSTIGFKGTLTGPLDFDGAQGALTAEGSDLGALLELLEAGVAAGFPFSIAGTLQRTGDHWQISDAKGALAGSAFTGALTLQEGSRATPDHLAIDLDFPELDLRPMLAGGPGATRSAADFGALPLRLDDRRGANIDASIAARQVDYEGLRLADAKVHGTATPDQIKVEQVAFGFAGGTVDVSATVSAVPTGSHVAANAGFSGIDAGSVSEFLGAGYGELTGKLEGGATLEMTGQTVREALGTSRGSAVLAMGSGSVARALLERASSDLRSLFRRSEGSASVRCVLGVIDLRDGRGAISPLRMETSEGRLTGGGELDLLRARLDVTIKPESTASGALALNIPFRISGDFAALRIEPSFGDPTTWLSPAPPARPMPGLPPSLQPLADRNPC